MDDTSNFVFKSMLFAKLTQAHAAFGREMAIFVRDTSSWLVLHNCEVSSK